MRADLRAQLCHNTGVDLFMTLLFAGIVAALVLMWRRLTAVEREVEYLLSLIHI